jgi:hypothetical protein
VRWAPAGARNAAWPAPPARGRPPATALSRSHCILRQALLLPPQPPPAALSEAAAAAPTPDPAVAAAPPAAAPPPAPAQAPAQAPQPAAQPPPATIPSQPAPPAPPAPLASLAPCASAGAAGAPSHAPPASQPGCQGRRSLQCHCQDLHSGQGQGGDAPRGCQQERWRRRRHQQAGAGAL